MPDEFDLSADALQADMMPDAPDVQDLPPFCAAIEEYQRGQALLRVSEFSTPDRVTSVVGCPEAWLLRRSGVPQEPVSPRALEVFDAGNEIEARTVKLLIAAGLPLLHGGKEQIEVLAKVGVDPWSITVPGHPDGFYIHKGEKVLVEIKSMSRFGFAEFKRGHISDSYLDQVHLYMRATGLTKCCFLAVGKDTQERGERWVFLDPARLDMLDRRVKQALMEEASLKSGDGHQPHITQGWCKGIPLTHYGKSLGRSEAIQRPNADGKGMPAGYCSMAYACPLVGKAGYVHLFGDKPGWLKDTGPNETLGAKGNREKILDPLPDALPASVNTHRKPDLPKVV